MIKKIAVFAVLLHFCAIVSAQRQLSGQEISQIFTALTQNPRTTWISTGTIQATHEEYKAPQITDANIIKTQTTQQIQSYKANANKPELTYELQQMKLAAIPFNVKYDLSNESTMNTNETVKYDGNKFYWEIVVTSITETVKPSANLAGNYYTHNFDLNGNQRRVFAWDGQKYTKYYRPANQVIITSEKFPVAGPLTAGVIPWGYGLYTADNMLKSEPSAFEVQNDNQTEINLILNNDRGTETFILDPAKNYAVMYYSLLNAYGRMRTQFYGNYQLADGKWCPSSVVIEDYDMTTQPQKLLKRDTWDINFGSEARTMMPAVLDFSVKYDTDAFIEDYTIGDEEPLQYRYAPAGSVSIEKLKQMRLTVAAISEKNKQNCATASIGYVCEKMGFGLDSPMGIYSIFDKSSFNCFTNRSGGIQPAAALIMPGCLAEEFCLRQSKQNDSSNSFFASLSQMVHGPEGETSMLEMKCFIEEKGKAANVTVDAVKTDLETLQNLRNSQIIVHLPNQNHFSVVGDIDSRYVRLVDLSSNYFFRRYSTDDFKSIWDGIALIVSNYDTSSYKLAKIDENQLGKIYGACGPGLACTKKLQNFCVYSCPQLPECPLFCGGTYEIFWPRYGCKAAPSGTCNEGPLDGYDSAPCEFPDPNSCVCGPVGNFRAHFINACK